MLDSGAGAVPCASQPRLYGAPVETDHRIDRLGRMAPLQQAQVVDVDERPFDVLQRMLRAQWRIERRQVDLPRQVALEQAPQRSRPMIVEIEDAQRVLVVGGWRHLNLSGGKLACRRKPNNCSDQKDSQTAPREMNRPRGTVGS